MYQVLSSDIYVVPIANVYKITNIMVLINIVLRQRWYEGTLVAYTEM